MACVCAGGVARRLTESEIIVVLGLKGSATALTHVKLGDGVQCFGVECTVTHLGTMNHVGGTINFSEFLFFITEIMNIKKPDSLSLPCGDPQPPGPRLFGTHSGRALRGGRVQGGSGSNPPNWIPNRGLHGEPVQSDTGQQLHCCRARHVRLGRRVITVPYIVFAVRGRDEGSPRGANRAPSL